MKKIFAHLFIYPFLWLHDTWPIWFYFLNRKGRKMYARFYGRRQENAENIVRDLEQNGIAITDVDELFPGRNILPELKRYVDTQLPSAKTRKDKPFLLQVNEYHEVLDFKNPFVRLALEPAVLAVINGYLKLCAKFHYYSVAAALPVSPETIPLKSQKWHRDFDDKKLCKMFIYLSDVDETSGPFTYVRESHLGGRWHNTFPPVPSKGAYPPMEEVARVIPKENMQVCTGQAGTVIFADTRGLHRGGFATQKQRIMFTAEYASEGAFLPIHYRYPENIQEELRKLSPPAIFALSKSDFLTRMIRGASLVGMRIYR